MISFPSRRVNGPRIAFAPNKPETAELVSHMAGDATSPHAQISIRGGSLFGIAR